MHWNLEVVPVPVSDVDRAKEFYAERVGFVVDHDLRFGSYRVVRLTPPGSGCSIVLGPASSSAPVALQGLKLVVTDLDVARAGLVARGVAASAVQHFEGADRVDGAGPCWNSFVFFDDPDGNGWILQQATPPGGAGVAPLP